MTAIRRATLEDIPACVRLVADWERAQPYLAGTPGDDVIADAFRAAFPAREIWVVGGPVEGYMSVDPAEGKIGALYLERPGRGIGRQLIGIAKAGRDALWLTVHEANLRAQAFYRREGFAVEGRAEEPQAPVLRMAWRRTECA